MKPARLLLFALLIAAGILIGYGYGRWYGTSGGTESAGKISPPQQQPSGYYCPMHPNVRSDKPGDCPICGMKLIPDAAPTSEPVANGETDAGEMMPPGTIRVSPHKQQLIGVTYGEVTAATGTHEFRAVGKVAMDETAIAKVQPKIEGWIERVFVDFTGKLVAKGQPLLTLYSPEMLASQQEYLLAIRARELMRGSPLAGTLQQSESLLAAARKRLELWDLSETQIEEITRTGKPIKNITLYAPIGGYVMSRNAFPSQRITPDTELYTIADLSRVWIMADVFESEASMVRMGMPVTISLPYAGGRKLRGRVDNVQPQVDMATRTLQVRIEAANPGVALKPGMFADVEFQMSTSARLTVPSEAVLHTGLRTTVFVDRGNGFLEPRQVETGERIGDRIEIRKGLSAGERVVTSGNFLIDSESQLKAAAAGMSREPQKKQEQQQQPPQKAPDAGAHKHD